MPGNSGCFELNTGGMSDRGVDILVPIIDMQLHCQDAGKQKTARGEQHEDLNGINGAALRSIVVGGYNSSAPLTKS